ncbi:MAG: ABC transporter ATP-binding protein [Bacilli bacterium]
MVREYIGFIKNYINLAKIKTKYMIIIIVSALIYKGFYVLVPLIGSLIIKYLELGNNNMVYVCLFAYFMSYLLYNASLYINYKVYGYNMNYYYDLMQTRVLNKLSTVDSGFNKVISKGRLMNSINGHIIDIGDMNDEISETITGLIQVIAVFVIVGFKNIYVCLILLLFAVIYTVYTIHFDKLVNVYNERVIYQDDKFSNLLQQISTGLQEIKTFNMLDKLFSKIKIIHSNFNKNYSKKRDYITMRDNNVKYINYGFRVILYIIMITLMMNDVIGLDVLILVISYHSYIIEYIGDLMSNLETIREVNVKVNRVNDILNYKSSFVEYGNLTVDEIFGSIEFKNVSYSIKNKQILKNINLKVDHNKVLAIVGEAGSGKTTLFNLLLRIIEQDQGTITIDNIDIREFSKDLYTNTVAVINQRPFIFNMSIRKNLAFVDNNLDRQMEACKTTGIHDFIMSLSKGYDTELLEDGKNVSGGQKQMISIARTLLTDCEILLLDDITTSLDPDTATFIPKLIKNLKKDHTILMITKKPDLMKLADRIIVLDNGKIVGDGTHKELIENNEIYQVLQSRKSPSRIGVFDDV